MGSELIKSLMDESVQRVLEKNKLSEEYYKNLNKHTQCSKCCDKITRDNYKKDRSICKKCYSKYMLEYNSSRRGDYNKLDSSNNFDSLDKLDSSRKQTDSSKIDRSNNFDSSNKQVRSRKQVSARKQDRSSNQDVSNKEDRANNYITDVHPDLLCDRLREILEKSDRLESDNTMIKMILDELLRVKAITKRQYNAMYQNCGLK